MDFLFKINKHTCKTSVLIFLLCFWYQNLQAQTNLVSNPSFEQYINCPSGIKDDKPTIWYKPDRRGAGYRNACSVNGSTGVPYHYAPNGTGYQYAKTGLAYVFMFYMNSPMSNARNYFQVKLFDTLKRGKCYYAECNTNLSNSCKIACNNQSILFTNNPIYADTISPPREIILANPQITNFNNELIKDTLNWVKVSGVFIAQGGEQYLTLGNFKDDSHTNYVVVQPTGYYGASYYVDDVSVYALDSLPLKANAGLDTTIALGDSTFIGSLTNGIPNIKWYDTGGNIIDTGRPGFYVQPTTTTT